VSHGWLAPGHPDPKGRRRDDIGTIPIASSKCIFWDFLSLFQVDAFGQRTDSEEFSFRTALHSMHLIYANPKWDVYRIITMPEDAVNKVPYTRRGWCVFESSTAGLGARVMQTIKDGELVFTEATPVPMTPTKFQDTVKELHFTSKKADSKMVLQLFKSIFPRLAAHEEMRFFTWGDDNMREFLQVLTQFTGVKVVKINNMHPSCKAQMSEDMMHHFNSVLIARGGELRVAFKDESGTVMIWKGGELLDLTNETLKLITM